MPSLLRSAQLKPDVNVADVSSDDEDDDEDDEVRATRKACRHSPVYELHHGRYWKQLLASPAAAKDNWPYLNVTKPRVWAFSVITLS